MLEGQDTKDYHSRADFSAHVCMCVFLANNVRERESWSQKEGKNACRGKTFWKKTTARKKMFSYLFFRNSWKWEIIFKWQKNGDLMVTGRGTLQRAGKTEGPYCWYRKITTVNVYLMIPSLFFLLPCPSWYCWILYNETVCSTSFPFQLYSSCLHFRACLLFTRWWRKIVYSLRIWKMNMH